MLLTLAPEGTSVLLDWPEDESESVSDCVEDFSLVVPLEN